MKTLARILPALTVAAALVAQSATVKQPKVKNNKEAELVNAVFQAADDDSRIAAAENLLTKFHDTEFKPLALYMATVAAQNKNDFEKLVIYGERTLEADPKFYAVMLMMATGYAQKTREFDFDKDEKLAKVEKLAKEGMELAKTATKMQPQITDEQWEAIKKDFLAQGHEALALAANVRKKYDVAAAEFKAAIENQQKPDPATMARLGSVYNGMGKWDDALAILDKANAVPDVNPAVKQYVAGERVKALMGKKKAEAAAPAAPKP
jgi:tetratricopeptide (TPR) repeat protein